MILHKSQAMQKNLGGVESKEVLFICILFFYFNIYYRNSRDPSLYSPLDYKGYTAG